MKYYYEDLHIGDEFESDYYTVSSDEIISFAEKYDKRPIHLKSSSNITVIASGWLICSLAMKQSIDALLSNSSAYISPGIEKIEWKKSLYPNDTIKTKLVVLNKRLSNSRKNIGIINFKITMSNQNNEEIMSMLPSCFFKCKYNRND